MVAVFFFFFFFFFSIAIPCLVCSFFVLFFFLLFSSFARLFVFLSVYLESIQATSVQFGCGGKNSRQKFNAARAGRVCQVKTVKQFTKVSLPC